MCSKFLCIEIFSSGGRTRSQQTQELYNSQISGCSWNLKQSQGTLPQGYGRRRRKKTVGRRPFERSSLLTWSIKLPESCSVNCRATTIINFYSGDGDEACAFKSFCSTAICFPYGICRYFSLSSQQLLLAIIIYKIRKKLVDKFTFDSNMQHNNLVIDEVLFNVT